MMMAFTSSYFRVPVLFVVVAAVAVSAAVSADAGGNVDIIESGDGANVAHVLTTKMVLNRYLVESKDLMVEYTLYNVGDAAALDITLTDDNFAAPGDFDAVAGAAHVRVARLSPGANVSHVLVVRPRRPAGYVNFTAASVTYRSASAGGGDDQSDKFIVSMSSRPMMGMVMSFLDYDKKFSSHLVDWIIFALLTLPSLGIPFLLWFSSKSKYDRIIREKRAESSKKRD